MSVEWNALGDEQKRPFLDETDKQKQRYDGEMKVYKA